MTSKNKVILSLALIAAVSACGYLWWLSTRQVEIIAVHQKGEFSDVMVKDFPLTEKGRITWWLKNKILLKDKYNIPQPASDGNYTMIFWGFGEGYKEDIYDRLCFEDMNTERNCIEKDKFMTVSRYRFSDTEFTFSCSIYSINKHGDIVKIKG